MIVNPKPRINPILLLVIGAAVVIGLPYLVVKGQDKAKAVASATAAAAKPTRASTATPGASTTPLPPTATLALPSATATDLPASATESASATIEASATPGATLEPSATAAASATEGAAIAPYKGAPLCLDTGELHDKSLFHTIWDSARGCHYDHEHGFDPFTPEMQAIFPNLYDFLGRVQIGHSNPSSPCENELGPCGAAIGKHGGFKWYADASVPSGCVLGFEGGTVCALAVAIEYHAFGDKTFELEPRVHSLAAAILQAKPGNLADTGLVEVIQHADYGQNVVPYQGDIMPYPNAPNPAYDPRQAPYISSDCIGQKTASERGQCRASREQILDRSLNTNSVWVSKRAENVAPSGSHLLAILFRVKDDYQVFDWTDKVYPFKFIWLCSGDGGAHYQASAGCGYNNSSTTPHEIWLDIPAAWDNLAGFDTNPDAGRITADGFVTSHGDLAAAGICAIPGAACFPIHMESAFVGLTSIELSEHKVANPNRDDTPDRDIYFCGSLVCREGDPGALSSGWIGQGN